jgi:hypothetical protein
MSRPDDELTNRIRGDVERMVGDAGRAAPPALETTLPAAPSRGAGWVPIAIAAAAVLVLVGGLIVIANRDGGETPTATPVGSTGTSLDTVPGTPPGSASPTTSTPAGSTPPTGAPPAQLYETIGSVIDDGTVARLCFIVLDSLPPQCGTGVALAGWAWDAIDVEQMQSGTTWVDQIHLTGEYDPGALTFAVTDVGLPTDADRERLLVFPAPDFAVPCPEPEGGWPAREQEWPGEQVAAIDGYAGSWIDESQQVMTVKFTGDLASAEAAVAELYSGPLCVVAARRDAAELQAIQEQLLQMSSIQFLSTAVHVDAAGESVVAEVIAPDPARQAAFDDEFGQGTVRLVARLRPIT